MKLSSREQLLKEADSELKNIKSGDFSSSRITLNNVILYLNEIDDKNTKTVMKSVEKYAEKRLEKDQKELDDLLDKVRLNAEKQKKQEEVVELSGIPVETWRKMSRSDKVIWIIENSIGKKLDVKHNLWDWLRFVIGRFAAMGPGATALRKDTNYIYDLDTGKPIGIRSEGLHDDTKSFLKTLLSTMAKIP